MKQENFLSSQLLVSTFQSIKLYAQSMLLCSLSSLFHEALCFSISVLSERYKMLSQDTRNRSASYQVSQASELRAEMDRYLAEELSFNSCQENGLSFFISREQSYPLFAHSTEDLVSAPASQASEA